MKTYYKSIGENLINFFSNSQNEVVIVAPFIKTDVLRSIVDSIRDYVSITCVSRWRPDEIAQGLNDLEIWHVIKSKQNAKLLLFSNLHAKYYRSDNCFAIGSANLTERALGWTYNSNFEFMAELSQDKIGIGSFEDDLYNISTEVNEQIYNYIKQLVSQFKEHQDINKNHYIRYNNYFGNVQFIQQREFLWIPKLRYPELLYKVYSERTDDIIKTTIEIAQDDLAYLDIPKGLKENSFNVYVASLLLQEKVVCCIDSYLTEPRRFGAMRDFIRKLFIEFNIKEKPTIAWQTIMRWLLYYLHARYYKKVYRHSEIFYKK